MYEHFIPHDCGKLIQCFICGGLKMNLNEKLKSRKMQFESKLPKETVVVMHRVTDDLRKSGIAERALKKGDKLPAFALPDGDGVIISSQDLLSRGPLVLSFYRGYW